MNSQPNTFENFHDRILKLEKQNRRLKQCGVAVLIIPALVLVMGQAPVTKQDTSIKAIEATEFILRDSNGKVRARLSADAGRGKLSETTLEFFDNTGLSKLTLTSGPVVPLLAIPGGFVQLDDAHGKGRTILSSAGIELRGDSEKLRGALEVNDSGAVLQLTDSMGSVKTQLAEDGAYVSGAVRVVDANGFQAVLGMSKVGNQSTGETRNTSAASLILFDKDGKVVWKTP
jgi:hypothetical protein